MANRDLWRFVHGLVVVVAALALLVLHILLKSPADAPTGPRPVFPTLILTQ